MSNKGLQAWDIQVLENFEERTNEEKMKHLLGWSILAANAHNAQPWEFDIDASHFVVKFFLNKERLLGLSDKANRQAITSIGCAIENFVQASTLYGLGTKVEYFKPDLSKDLTLCASVSLQEEGISTMPDASVFRAMKTRRINRSKCDPSPLPQEFLEKIQNIHPDQGLKLHTILDKATLIAFSELQYMANRAVIAIPGFRKELASHLISSDSNECVGMPGSTFGLSDALTSEIKRDLGQEGLLNPTWAAGFAAADRDGIKSAPAMFIVTGSKDDPNHWMKAGRLFQSLALEAEKHGLAVAMNAALVESTALSSVLKTRLRTIGRPLATFRIGYSTEERAHSPRIPVDDLIRTSAPSL